MSANEQWYQYINIIWAQRLAMGSFFLRLPHWTTIKCIYVKMWYIFFLLLRIPQIMHNSKINMSKCFKTKFFPERI